MDRISSGSLVFDELLHGGFEQSVITTLYGPSGAGKTTCCLLPMISATLHKKIIFIDTEGGLSVERLQQLTERYQQVLEQTILLSPVSFQEQKEQILRLKEMMSQKIGLIIVDSIAMLYRLERGQANGVSGINNDLGKQIAVLSEVARTWHIPILITNQVYADFHDQKKVNMVGGDILKYGSKCLVEITNQEGYREAIIQKHRSLPSEKRIQFKIGEKGFEKL